MPVQLQQIRLHPQRMNPDDEEDHQHDQLDCDDDIVEVCRFLDADDEDHGREHDSNKRDQIEDAILVRQRGGIDPKLRQLRRNAIQKLPMAIPVHEHRAWSSRDGGRQSNMEVLQQAQHIAAPARADRRRAECVLQHQVPTDDPGKDLAQGRIPVGIGGARHRDHRRKLRIAETREDARDRRHDEGVHHRRSGIERRSRPGEHEDTRANNSTNSEGDEIERSQRALQRMFARLRGFMQNRLNRFCCQQIQHSDPRLQNLQSDITICTASVCAATTAQSSG